MSKGMISVPAGTDSWPADVASARSIQEALSPRVIREDALGPVHHVAAVDVGFEDNGRTTRAAVAVLGFPDLVLQEQAISRSHTRFPYVPGYLSFRELPADGDRLCSALHLPLPAARDNTLGTPACVWLK